MEEEYDVICLGTGLKECILSGLMSVNQKKVLHMDRNSYYGGESASLNLEQLYNKFRDGQEPPAKLGKARQYCIDLCPKFLMACGDLVKILLHTKVTRYLEFKSVEGSFVFKKGGKIHKVPATAGEALSSGLMGFLQKRFFKGFLTFVHDFDENDAKTHRGFDLNVKPMKEVYSYFYLDANTVDFVGHALALYRNDAYLDKPAKECIEKCKLYAYSVSRYGKSPYIYPLWGLGGLPEGFSRLCAVHGGVYMLNKPVDEIVYHEDGKVKGVNSEGAFAGCKQMIADPSYFMGSDKIKKVGQVARCIVILNGPLPQTKDVDSCQIILPANQCGRKTDIYISMVSHHHQVAAKGKYVAVVSADVEGPELPEGVSDFKTARQHLGVALALLGKPEEAFFWVSDRYVACNDWKSDQCFITSSYDATTHFETATKEVMNLYENIMGVPIDLTVSAEPEDLQDPY